MKQTQKEEVSVSELQDNCLPFWMILQPQLSSRHIDER